MERKAGRKHSRMGSWQSAVDVRSLKLRSMQVHVLKRVPASEQVCLAPKVWQDYTERSQHRELVKAPPLYSFNQARERKMWETYRLLILCRIEG